MKISGGRASWIVAVVWLAATGAVRAESPPPLRTWAVVLEGCQGVPTTPSAASGRGWLQVDYAGGPLTYSITFSGFTGAETEAHIHGPAARGAIGPVLFTLPAGSPKDGSLTLTQVQQDQILAGQWYLDIHSSTYPDGELRGQIDEGGSACPPPVDASVGDAGAGGGADAAGADLDASGCGGCATGGGPGSLALAALGLALVGRRRRRAR
ncbi:MAG: CHRD domain-containing protein [Myxococcales bacterium]|nr:CHRD domain-containing protein [Myxococcales bacterium]